ncbi:MAG TPA: hypothetical protein VNO50_16485 [Pyrinomonadaceae bacterium]|nr:hypothetical protein [Pyrinomonadaceae bacterium]
MSYLDVPRLHFAGTFSADPSTLNNTPQNFDPATVITSQNDGWNPNGTGHWQFLNCQVQSVVYNDGSIGTGDPVIGSPVQGTDQPQIAKLVDLDSEQQMVSEIYGFQVQLNNSSGSAALVGNFEVAAFSDIWFRATVGGGDAPMGAFYQSVLTNIQWGDVSNSRFLEQLMAASPDLLSIKFNLDGINMSLGTPTFTQGRVVGTIGPATIDEPKHFVAGRLLRSAPGTDPTNPPITLQGTPPASPMFFAPFRVDDKRQVVLVDFGNSISTTTPGGPVNPTLGVLQLAILPGNELMGQVNYQAPNWYPDTAGIQEFAVQNFPVNNNQLGIVQLNADGTISAPLLQEDSKGLFVRADTFVFRLNPGETADVNFWATQFGQPAAQQQINLAQDANMVNEMQSPPNPTNIPVGTPADALATASGPFPTTLTTNELGQATLTLSASDPGNPRVFIDGQVYGVSYSLAQSNENPDPSNFLSVLVFNSYPELDSPTWQDVQPIFAQYAKLYPYMRGIIDLSVYNDVVARIAAIQRVFLLPKTDPGYMQVTRDMSRDKVNMILKWLDLGAPFGPEASPDANPPEPKGRDY